MACSSLGSHSAQPADPDPCTCLRPLKHHAWLQLPGSQKHCTHCKLAGQNSPGVISFHPLEGSEAAGAPWAQLCSHGGPS